MNVYLYERIWMWAAALMIAVLLAMTGIATFGYGIRPPSHVETIDPQQALADPRFQNPGVTTRPDGGVQVTMVAMMFAFLPDSVQVPAGRPVTFRITSPDVTHGFDIAGTNANTMVVPGYVSQFTYTFDRPGRHLIVCNEFCGNGHHVMRGVVIVEAPPP